MRSGVANFNISLSNLYLILPMQTDWPLCRNWVWRALWFGDQPSFSCSLVAIRMDEPVIVERVRKLRQEISEIKAANRIYWEFHQHNQAEKNDHERRRERLQEIRSELPILWAKKARF